MNKFRNLVIKRNELSLLCYGICILIFVLRQSEFNSINYIINYAISGLHGITLTIAIILIISRANKIGRKIFYLFTILTGVLLFNITVNDASTDLIYIVLFMMVLKDNNENDIYKTYFIFSSIALGFIIILCNLGVISDYTLRGRHYLGFKYSSFSSNYLLHTTLALLAWKKDNLKFWHWMFIEILNYYIWIMTDTTAVFVMVFCMPFLFYIIKKYQITRDIFSHKAFRILVEFSCIIFASITSIIQLIYHYYSDSALFVWLNYLLSLRLSLTEKAFQLYPITMFGQNIKWNTWTSSLTTLYNYFYVDSSYLQILLQFGIIILVMVCFCFVYIGKHINKERDPYIAVSLLMFLLHCCTDPQLLSFRYDFFIVSVIIVYRNLYLKKN